MFHRILVLNGPNINMLGIREVDIYGKTTYEDLTNMIYDKAHELGIEVDCEQSNHQGVLIDHIQDAYFSSYTGVVFNPGAYTHTSIALRDAIEAIKPMPVVEVHMSDIYSREDFRKVSYVRDVCAKSIVGHGVNGYLEALEYLVKTAEETGNEQ